MKGGLKMDKTKRWKINDGKPCYNANTTIIYSWDNIKGGVTSHQATNYPRIPMPANTTVNKSTGKLENKTVGAGVAR